MNRSEFKLFWGLMRKEARHRWSHGLGTRVVRLHGADTGVVFILNCALVGGKVESYTEHSCSCIARCMLLYNARQSARAGMILSATGMVLRVRNFRIAGVFDSHY